MLGHVTQTVDCHSSDYVMAAARKTYTSLPFEDSQPHAINMHSAVYWMHATDRLV